MQRHGADVDGIKGPLTHERLHELFGVGWGKDARPSARLSAVRASSAGGGLLVSISGCLC